MYDMLITDQVISINLSLLKSFQTLLFYKENETINENSGPFWAINLLFLEW